MNIWEIIEYGCAAYASIGWEIMERLCCICLLVGKWFTDCGAVSVHDRIIG
jgi:hypothetical protein